MVHNGQPNKIIRRTVANRRGLDAMGRRELNNIEQLFPAISDIKILPTGSSIDAS